MGKGDPGQEQFRRAITEMRNKHIAAALEPLMKFRAEVVGNDELGSLSGVDDSTKHHFLQHLINCDRMRRRVTFNPDNEPLGDKIAKAIDPSASIEVGDNPFASDEIQGQSGGLFDLPWALDGTDPDIALNSQINMKNGVATLLLMAIDDAIVCWTRLNSRNRTRGITRFDSMRMYGSYQEILEAINSFMGEENRVDVAQVLPSEEPLGPTDSPNRVGESSNSAVAQ